MSRTAKSIPDQGRPAGPGGEAARIELGDGLVCLIFTDWGDLDPVKADWDDLAQRSGAGIFASFDWRRTWWEFYGNRRWLEVRLVYSGGRLVAIFPFFSETSRLGGLAARFLRLVGCDHAGPVGTLVIEPGTEKVAAAALAASFEKSDSPPWDAVQMGPLPAYTPRLREFADALAKHLPAAAVTHCRDAGPHVLFEMADDYSAYLGSLAKKERSGVRRSERALGEMGHCEQVVVTCADEFPETLERFFESHECLWRAKGKPGWFNEWPRAKEFHRRLTQTLVPVGRAFIAEIRVEGKAVTARYCFRFGDILHAFQPSRADDAPWHRLGLGRLSFAKLVEYAVSDGVKMVDGGAGLPYEHKLRLGGRLAHSQYIHLHRRNWLSKLRVALFRLAAVAVDVVYAKIWYRRLAHFAGVGGRPFRAFWIRSRIAFPSGDSCAEERTETADGRRRGV